MPIVAVIFGWPAVIASVLLVLTSIARGRWQWALAGAAIGSPFLLYLALTPRLAPIAPIVGLSYFAAAYALARGDRAVAAALTIPFLALAAFVASQVLRQ